MKKIFLYFLFIIFCGCKNEASFQDPNIIFFSQGFSIGNDVVFQLDRQYGKFAYDDVQKMLWYYQWNGSVATFRQMGKNGKISNIISFEGIPLVYGGVFIVTNGYALVTSAEEKSYTILNLQSNHFVKTIEINVPPEFRFTTPIGYGQGFVFSEKWYYDIEKK